MTSNSQTASKRAVSSRAKKDWEELERLAAGRKSVRRLSSEERERLDTCIADDRASVRPPR
jgi:hypothetical protein